LERLGWVRKSPGVGTWEEGGFLRKGGYKKNAGHCDVFIDYIVSGEILSIEDTKVEKVRHPWGQVRDVHVARGLAAGASGVHKDTVP